MSAQVRFRGPCSYFFNNNAINYCFRCLLPCHVGPCPSCKEVVKQPCHCGALKLTFSCHAWTESTSEMRSAMLRCGTNCTSIIACGHQCAQLCHDGDHSAASTCTRKRVIKCACGRRRQNVVCRVAAEKQEASGGGALQLDCEPDGACAKTAEAERDSNESTSSATSDRPPVDMQKLLQGRRRRRDTRRFDDDDEDESSNWWTKVRQSKAAKIGAIAALVVALVAAWWNVF